MLDGRARDAYRHRIEELREEIDEALADGRLEEAEARQAELDLLVAQLARRSASAGGPAAGVGGRAGPAQRDAGPAQGDHRLADGAARAGAALDRGVRTGPYCAYEPLAGDIRWIVQSRLNGRRPD